MEANAATTLIQSLFPRTQKTTPSPTQIQTQELEGSRKTNSGFLDSTLLQPWISSDWLEMWLIYPVYSFSYWKSMAPNPAQVLLTTTENTSELEFVFSLFV